MVSDRRGADATAVLALALGAVWEDEVKRVEMGTIVEGWVESVRRMAGVLV